MSSSRRFQEPRTPGRTEDYDKLTASIRIPGPLRLTWRNLRVNMDPMSLVVIVGLPAMYLVFMGTMYPAIVPSFNVNGVSYNYASYLAPGIMAFQAVMSGFVAGSILWVDRRLNMFSQILSGSFTRIQYLTGIITATAAVSLAGGVAMMIMSVPLGSVFYFSIAGLGLALLHLVVGGIFFSALMLVIAAKVRSNNVYNSLQVLFIFVTSFVSNAFYPLNEATPVPLRIMASANPLTYIADGVRAGLGPASLLFSTWSPIETIVLSVETSMMFFLAYRTYSRARTSAS